MTDHGAVDPRVARSRAAVLDATVDLVAERGIAETSVDAIAERSGVAKTTIYRHWERKPEVVLDALRSVISSPDPPDTGSLRGDLAGLLHALVDVLTDPRLGPLLTGMIDAAERDPEYGELRDQEVEARHRVIREVIVRGVERGELAEGTDPDEMIMLLIGGLFYRRTIGRGSVESGLVDRVVARVLAAYGAPSSG